MSTQKRTYDYANHSRGHKTKGNSYKDRYVEIECPVCSNMKAYKDTWRTKIAYTCLKRSCRNKWYVSLTPEEIQANLAAEREAEAAREAQESSTNEEAEG